jgi:hypothetical protein
VVGFKHDAKKRPRPEATWWTVHFDVPANKRLSCHREEIVKMKADAEYFRLKRLTMEEQLGKQLVLSWTQEDHALSLSDWDNDLRIGVVRTYIVLNTPTCTRNN